ncbi:S-layer homology domain-containing protein [Caldisalinibacter kiritimatiensis]|uniref:SLH domain-containing protein n=1 Tax=Caldisalinibacter kiritimatiensis TaxID=1304284 RepID=R1AQ93_9FIRM|nr:S-layer homology domain-containing protein [Caldisalinibacter kiritimatiensis]EOC99297.1 hypothetical protein L21TH_2681 [Caldisalinibacter kiritimatiensis]
MFKRFIAFLIAIFIVTSMVLSQPIYADSITLNPPRDVLEKKIEEVAKLRGIPSVILKSIARVESVFKQFNPDGSVYTGRSGSIGLMQIHNAYGMYDSHRLKYDITYNIEAGADVLLMKWKMANDRLPRIGDMNPNILEHWYFALWAYNGWVESNNPNMVPYKYRTWTKKHTYQQLIYMVAEKEYGQKITPIDPKLLLKRGLPSKNLVFDTPKDHHYGDIILYEKGDLVEVDVSNSLTLRDAPAGREISKFDDKTLLNIIDGPVLKDGFFWYKVKEREGNKEGWIVRNWIVKVGDVKNGVYPFDDIEDNWAVDYIIDLYKKGIIEGSNGKFNPNSMVTREEMSAFIARAFDVKNSEYELEFKDIDNISFWAIPYVKAVTSTGLITSYEDNTFAPKKHLTREEAAVIISRLFNDTENDIETESSSLQFNDIKDLSPSSLKAIKIVYNKGIMSGKSELKFCPKDYLTRAEVSKILHTLLNMKNEINLTQQSNDEEILSEVDSTQIDDKSKENNNIEEKTTDNKSDDKSKEQEKMRSGD